MCPLKGSKINHLTARGDIHNQGGNFGAEKHLRLRAKRDFINQTVTHTSKTSSDRPGYHESHCHTTLGQRAGLYVLQPQGVLEAAAGRDITLTAARVLNAGVDGQTRFTAGRDINLGAVQVGEQHKHIDHYYTQSQGSSRDVGSQLKTAGDISFQAGHNFTAIAAQLSSGIRVNHSGALSLRRERDPAMTAPSSSEESLLPAESLATSSADPQRATGSLRIQAGNNIDIQAGQASHHKESHWRGSDRSVAGQEVLAQEAQLAVEAPQGELQVAAQQDVCLSAVQLRNRGAAGHTTLTAGRHLTLDTLRSEEQQSRVQDADNFLHQSRTAAVGSSIQTVGDVRCQAGERFQATAAQVSSRDGAVQVAATQQLELLSGEATEDYDHATKHTEEGFFSSKTIRTRDIRHQSMALGSSFSGRQVTMIAGDQAKKTGQGHISVDGSSVVSDRQTTLVANTISITSAENHQQQHYTRQEKKSGLFSTGGASFCIGSQRQSLEQQRAGITHNSSSVGSLQGDVTIQALEHYQQLASQVVAPQGNVEITAAELAILDEHNQLQLTQESSSSTSGFTVSVSNPALSALQTAKQLQSAVSQTSDPRMHALAAAAGGLAAKNTYDALQCKPQQLGGINVTATFGSSESHSESSEHHTTAQRSLVAGQNLLIQANRRNATIQGDLQAKERGLITAAGDLKLLASENRSRQKSSQSSSSHSFGVGRGLVMGMSEGEGSSQGESCSYQLAQARAGQKIELESGRNILAQGVVSAQNVKVRCGANCTIESLEDTDHQEGEQRQIGINLDIGPMASGSVNFNQSNYHHDFASVQQQAGIEAGDLGYQGDVKLNTHLGGGGLKSSAKAVINNLNHWGTGTLTQSAIENRNDHDAQSISGSIGFSQHPQKPGQPALQDGGVGKNQLGQAAPGALQVPGSGLPSHHGLSATIPIVMNASGHDRSTTRSGISGAGQSVTLTNPAAQLALTGQTPEQAIAAFDASVTSDKDSSNALSNSFNLEEIKAGFQIVEALTREVGTFLDNRAKEQTKTQTDLTEEQGKALEQQNTQKIAALQERLQENQLWEMGGKGRILMSALSLAAGSNITGSTGQLLQAATVNVIQSYGAQQIKLLADSMNSEVARTALQGLLAGAGAAAQGQSATPAALGASASVVLNNLIDSAYGETSSTLSLAKREARKNLVSTLITGTTHALGGEAALANAAATIEAENNAVFAPLIPVALGTMWIADKALTAYYIHQDVTALRSGEKTLEQIALERGEQYIIGALVGNLAGHGYKAIKQGGKWVAKAIKEGTHHGPQLATATAGATQQFSRQAGQINSRTHGIYQVNRPQPSVNPVNKIWSVKGRIKEAQLPTKGKIRFVPREGYAPNESLRRSVNKGYIDRFGNEWTKGPSRTAGQPFEWDVIFSDRGQKQLGWASRDGKHINVSLDGKITHR
ncbi:polymorphic toxin type 17 domain-containing protein [unidentified bacterial endosymbiont]|uniref:polymorphic toxin type 17 domain-containing protein n=1 Tax=unidentified bacterial endosymbiont TaxID=2355 RepID=UPI0020A0702D|nr:polymorphic toxin type 17 domain-containing protein [unidentified bacterial endosymbiont]